MAQSLDEAAELWLPSEFLSEDDILADGGSTKRNADAEFEPSFSFPAEFPFEYDSFGSNSALGSPVESVAGSTEAESSDEEDLLAGLTCRLAQSSVHNPNKLAPTSFTVDCAEKNRRTVGSPQSILSGIGSWCGSGSVSSRGSPNGPSQGPSPPVTPLGVQDETWDLIHAAAGQVARMKMSQQGRAFLDQHHRSSQPVPVRAATKNPNVSLYSKQDFGRNSVTHVNQYEQARRDQMLKQQCASVWGRPVKMGWASQQQQMQSTVRNGGCEMGRCVRPLGLPQSAWPPLQVQGQGQRQQRHIAGSGMRAVFLGESGGKGKCAGTGVFLPRRYGNPPDPRWKTGCSTVLLPAKVVQALNLNFDDVNGEGQPRFGGGFTLDHDAAAAAAAARRNSLLMEQQRRSNSNNMVRGGEGVLNELRLPQDWT